MLVVGCGTDEDIILTGSGNVLDELDPDSGSAEIVLGYQDLIDLARDRAEYFCECEHQTTEGELWETCLRELNPQDPPPVVECTKRVLSQGTHALPGLKCERSINSDYMKCIRSAPTCLDFNFITNCEIDRITAGLECDEFPFPWDVWASVQELCWGNPSMSTSG